MHTKIRPALVTAACAAMALSGSLAPQSAEAGTIYQLDFISTVGAFRDLSIRYDDLDGDGVVSPNELLENDPLITDRGQVFPVLSGLPNLPLLADGSGSAWSFSNPATSSGIGATPLAFDYHKAAVGLGVFLAQGQGRLIATSKFGALSDFTIDFQDFDFDQRISPDEVFVFSGVTIGGEFFDMVRQVPIKVGIADGTGYGWSFGSSSSSNTGASQFITGWDYQIVNRGGPGTPIYTAFDPRPGFAPPPPGMDLTPQVPPGTEPETPSIPLPAGVWLLAGALGLLGVKGRIS